ncbi:alanine--tRNA ligase [Chlamydiota bacterium]
MDSNTLRKSFLAFFKQKKHTIKASDSLVPSNDPSLLFTTAGMVQFKPLYQGAPLEFSRAVTVQKCLRAGGKGSDLENVGRTIRHHTFFEMLGNFSFGDYFKKDAILWAWEYLTEVVKLDKERLLVSVYTDDDEAFSIWRKTIGLKEERIVRLGEKDNFWGPAGDSGACGPSSEIHFDLGEAYSCGQETCQVGCDCERFLEIWNLVFPQYFQEQDGKRKPLERIGIDTGMGLERLAFVSQGVSNNYQTDLFQPIIHAIEKITQCSYQEKNRRSFHVISDHIRALCFALAENILPSNEGRGYVLRRILRRAVKFGRNLDVKAAFLYKLVPVVVAIMKEAYPDLGDQEDHIVTIIKPEEERFQETLSVGLEIFSDIIEELRKRKQTVMSGDNVFKLYDTYGFPVDLVEELAEEKGVSIDLEGFQKRMNEQKDRARASWQGKSQVATDLIYLDIKKKQGVTTFTGYNCDDDMGKIVALIKDAEQVDQIEAGESGQIILDKTPFYAESGGQVGDKGRICSSEFEFIVEKTIRPVEGIIAHEGRVISGSIHSGHTVDTQIDEKLRTEIKRHHTATHLLHCALRSVLGDHVRQAGSLVAPDRLRFDFSHSKGLTSKEVRSIEKMVNNVILKNVPVKTIHTKKEAAQEMGAIALFGEKYADEVRVITVGTESMELCGGTHVSATGEIGLCKIVSEGSVASGVRRIEAVCGERAYELITNECDQLNKLSVILKVSRETVVQKVEKLLDGKKELEKELERIKMKLSALNIGQIVDDVAEIEGVYCYQNPKNVPEKVDALLKAGDLIKDRIKKKGVSSYIIVLGSHFENRPYMVVMISNDVIKRGIKAQDILNKTGEPAGVRGGGRPDMAQGGGKNVDKMEDVLNKDHVRSVIRKILLEAKKTG